MFLDYLENKKIVFLNDRHEEADTGREDRRKLYDKRILPLLDRNDLAVFGEEIDPFLWNYYRNFGLAGIDRKNIFYVYNYLEYPSLTNALLNNPTLIKQIRQQKPDILIPYIESKDVQILAKRINCRLLRHYKLVEEINNKANYREIIKNLGFPLIPGFRAVNIGEAKRFFKILKNHGFSKILVKKERSVGGFGVFIIRTERELEECIEINFSNTSSFLVEGFLENIIASPNVQYKIWPNRVEFVVMTNQLFGENKISHKGNYFPLEFDNLVKNKINNLSLKFCDFLQRNKCFGIVGIDYLVTSNGEVYSTEANVRFNASTFAFFIARNLFGGGNHIFWQTFTLRKKTPISFVELFSCFSKIFIQRRGDFGIFPIDIGCLNIIGGGEFMSIGRTEKQCNAYINKFFSQL